MGQTSSERASSSFMAKQVSVCNAMQLLPEKDKL